MENAMFKRLPAPDWLDDIPTFNALTDLFDRYVQLTQEATGHLPRLAFDPDWRSPCQCNAPETPVTATELPLVCDWLPCLRPVLSPLAKGLGKAFEIPIHPALTSYYGSYWSEGLVVDSPWGELQLIQLWNEEDEAMLAQNLIGHLMVQRKKRLAPTFFIGCGENDIMVSLDNQSGHIVLERPGKAPVRQLAPSLADFLLAVTPTTRAYAA